MTTTSPDPEAALPTGAALVADAGPSSDFEHHPLAAADSSQRQLDAALTELREQQETLRLAMRGGRMGTWVRDLQTGAVHWDRELEELFGLPPGGFGRSELAFFELVHPQDVPRLERAIERAIAAKRDYQAQFRIRHASGEWRWMEGRGRATYDELDRPRKLYGIGIDVNERHAAEAALRASEQRHRELVEQLLAAQQAVAYHSELTRTVTENVTAGLFMMDANGRCTYMNPAAEAMTGYRFEDVREAALHDAIHHHHPDGRPYPLSECPIDRALPEKNAVRKHEDVFVRRDGTFFPVLCAAEPIVRDGVPVGTVIEVRDVTEEKEAEHVLRESEAQLRAALAVKDEFLGLVSHELRTPMTVILGMSQILSRDGVQPERAREIAQDIAESAEVLNGLVESMLLLARIDQSEVRKVREPAQLHRIASKVVEAFAARHPYRSFRLDLRSRATLVEVHQTWAERVVENLIGNAVKYSPADKEILIVVDASGGEGTVCVLDGGPGVADAEAAMLFEPFYRSPSVREKAAGAGLGLAVIKRIVHLLGGRVWVDNRPEGGAEFGFALPLTADEDS
jgi:PAS domain S-box-containing protein